ncbi:hypothetical protein J1N35_014816 [Gossypium stocksii]|uniref:Uncharacterized protein n=1 Tax=Gossypium stocksii TaxID=47602 RepID=A0A9D4A9A4_9ROSI|nr:hypothetical protein J1N35_014816 [Gossypium stocksii]
MKASSLSQDAESEVMESGGEEKAGVSCKMVLACWTCHLAIITEHVGECIRWDEDVCNRTDLIIHSDLIG